MSQQHGDNRNIILVGFMGTGKTTVGRLLARRLYRQFLDTDAWVVGTTGMLIPEIFAEFGEKAFRDTETEAARHVAESERLVVSTGGGIMGREENIRLLRKNGVLINLTARPEVIVRRTAPWTNRPILRDAPNPEEAVERLLAERAPQYAQADWTFDTSELPLPEVVDLICARLPSL
jgi:shikimate kinase